MLFIYFLIQGVPFEKVDYTPGHLFKKTSDSQDCHFVISNSDIVKYTFRNYHYLKNSLAHCQ
jgi:hypothetical protein